jgi:hypothetical protein
MRASCSAVLSSATVLWAVSESAMSYFTRIHLVAFHNV